MVADLRRTVSSWELIWNWSLREVKVRYAQALLGASWAVLQPLVMMLMFTLVFSRIAKIPSDGIPYPVFAYSGLLPWTFFSSAFSFAAVSLVGNTDLVTKVSCPREAFPIASVLSVSFDFLVSALIMAGLMAYYGVAPSLNVVYLPLIFAVEMVFTMGVVFISSAVVVFFRDLKFAIPLVLQMWLFVTPVAYPASAAPEQFKVLYWINPMAGIVESFRKVLVLGVAPDPGYLGATAVLSVFMLVGGYWSFKRLERSFADII